MQKEANMKKKKLTAALLAAFLLSALAGTLFVNSATANPLWCYPDWRGVTNPRSDTQPPTIKIRAPQNDAVFLQNEVELALFVNTHPRLGTFVTI